MTDAIVMPADLEGEPPEEKSGKHFRSLVLGSIGIVYGDIGTSPIYAFRESMKMAGATPESISEMAAYGVASLILWALIIVVTLKYVIVMLRAGNRGEGGIFSLMALAQKSSGRKFGLIFVMGIIGAGLFYGDAAITPAISVLSAVEGLELIRPEFEKYVIPISVAILVVLFMVQKKGTKVIGNVFGPVMVIWFLAIGAAGLWHIAGEPQILKAINPYYAVAFLKLASTKALAVLGLVFLAVTGAEALYADLGHFRPGPIRCAWTVLVFPCLALNYLGQAAFLLDQPAAIENPLFLMMPHALLIPFILLATLATVIASQAVISGAFSLTRQAILMGLLPRMAVRHLSAQHEGQIYISRVNRFLLIAVLLLCAIFGSSSALASAYGIAVTGTMLVTSLLLYQVARKLWRIGFAASLALVAPFVCVELLFLIANLDKLAEGGYVSLLFACVVIALMLTWVRGTRYLYNQTHRSTMLLSDLTEMLDRHPADTVPGTAIFLTSDPLKTPIALLQNLKHNRVIHERNIVLTVVTTESPVVGGDQRYMIEHVSSTMMRIILIFGYMESPDVPRALRQIDTRENLHLDFMEVSFFLGRRTIVSSHQHGLQIELARAWQSGAAPSQRDRFLFDRKKKKVKCAPMGLPSWQNSLFISMANSSVAATDFFRIPRNQVVEMGMQLPI